MMLDGEGAGFIPASRISESSAAVIGRGFALTPEVLIAS